MLLIPVQEASLIMIQILVIFLFSHLNSTQSLPVKSLTILFQISFVSRYTSFFLSFQAVTLLLYLILSTFILFFSH